jgi:hypothetical protein
LKALHAVTLIAAGAAALTGCASSGGTRTPDEFRVVRKAPLTVPPEFNLRPPSPGESRPQELTPDMQARVALFGGDIGADASQGEKLLVEKAGGAAVERTIRASIDYDTTQTLRKNRSFADTILNFGRSDNSTINPDTEAERLKEEKAIKDEVIGTGEVLIKRQRSGKLPGL